MKVVVVAICSAFFGVVCAFSYLLVSSRMSPFSVERSVIQLPALSEGAVQKIAIPLTNNTDVPIEVVGVRTSCNCLLHTENRFFVPARSVYRLEVEAHVSFGDDRKFEQDVIVMFSWQDELLQLPVKLRCSQLE